jgi:hypothetical protein
LILERNISTDSDIGRNIAFELTNYFLPFKNDVIIFAKSLRVNPFTAKYPWMSANTLPESALDESGKRAEGALTVSTFTPGATGAVCKSSTGIASIA